MRDLATKLVSDLREKKYSSTALVLSIIVTETYRVEDRVEVLQDILEILNLAKDEVEFKHAIWTMAEEAREESLEAEEEE